MFARRQGVACRVNESRVHLFRTCSEVRAAEPCCPQVQFGGMSDLRLHTDWSAREIRFVDGVQLRVACRDPADLAFGDF